MDEKPDTDGAGASAAAVQMMTERPVNELVESDQDIEHALGEHVGKLLDPAASESPKLGAMVQRNYFMSLQELLLMNHMRTASE